MSRTGPRTGAIAHLAALTIVIGAVMPAAAILSTGTVAQLTTTPETNEKPCWSPDGKQIVFVSGRNGARDLYIMNRAGTGVQQLTQSTGAGRFSDQPAWSPDGKRIAFTSNRGADGSPDIWVIDVATKAATQITKTPGIDWMPCWSPDGSRIAFVSDRSDRDSLWMVDSDGQHPRLLVTGAWDPAWSPLGDQIAYYSTTAGSEGVWSVNINDNSTREILSGGSDPCWSPDGRRLCVVMARASHQELWIVGSNGKNATPLRGLTGNNNGSPSWSSACDAIAYDSATGGARSIFVANLKAQRPMAELTAPEDGAIVKGVVQVRGTAKADYGDLSAVTLEFGAGNQPTTWTPIGQATVAVDNGLLANWDTSGLSGTFTLRLTATDEAGDSSYAYRTVHLQSELGVQFVTDNTPGTMVVGQTYQVPLTCKNIGTMTWLNTSRFAVSVGYHWFDVGGNMVIPKGPLTPLPRQVNLGESVDVQATVKAPSSPGTYILEWDLIQGDLLWFSDRNASTRRVTVKVEVPLSADLQSQDTPAKMIPAQVYTVHLAIHNRGAATWDSSSDNNVVVGYHWVDADGQNVGEAPIITKLPQPVAPDGTATLDAQVRAPAVAGTYSLKWDLRHDAGEWFSDTALSDLPTVPVIVQGLYGVQYGPQNTPNSMQPGESYVVNLNLTNTGSVAWEHSGPNALSVGARWYDAAGHPVNMESLTVPLPYAVPAGNTVSVAAQVQAPGKPGNYELRWDLRRTDGTWLSDKGARYLSTEVIVARPAYKVRFSSSDQPVSMVVGQPYTVNVDVTNQGLLVWSPSGDHAVSLTYHWIDNTGQEVSVLPVKTPLPFTVELNQSVHLQAQVRAPEMPGNYTLKWDLYQEGEGWFSQHGASTLNMPVKVDVLYKATFVGHDTPIDMVAGQRYEVKLRVRNDGALAWQPAGDIPVQLSYRWTNDKGDIVVTRGAVTNLPGTLKQGETVELNAVVQAPTVPGSYILKWDMLQGGLLWFAEKGSRPLEVIVQVH